MISELHKKKSTGRDHRRLVPVPGLVVLFVVLALLTLSFRSPVSAHDVSSPRSGCPPIEEEVVDLHLLAEMLADTAAVGLITKIKLKRDIDQMISRLENYHKGKRRFTLNQLEEQYNMLLMKIAAYLQDKDLLLHRHLCNAWTDIWEDLRDYDRFHEYMK